MEKYLHLPCLGAGWIDGSSWKTGVSQAVRRKLLTSARSSFGKSQVLGFVSHIHPKSPASYI